MGTSWDFYVCMWFFQGHTYIRYFHSLNPSAATSIGCEKWGSSLQLPMGRDHRKRREKKKTIGETPSDILQGLTHHNEIFISQKQFHQEPKIAQALRSPSFVRWHWINDISVWKQPTLWWPLKSWSKRAQTHFNCETRLLHVLLVCQTMHVPSMPREREQVGGNPGLHSKPWTNGVSMIQYESVWVNDWIQTSSHVSPSVFACFLHWYAHFGQQSWETNGKYIYIHIYIILICIGISILIKTICCP
jgi:hypothetical protein